MPPKELVLVQVVRDSPQEPVATHHNNGPNAQSALVATEQASSSSSAAVSEASSESDGRSATAAAKSNGARRQVPDDSAWSKRRRTTAQKQVQRRRKADGQRLTFTDTVAGEEEDDEEESDGGSSTSLDDLEVCEKCGGPGEVIECDLEGCNRVYHVACVPKLNGKVPKGRWVCPYKHEERCHVCGGEGKVILCDVENCKRMFHVKCLPRLKGVPGGFWECPLCVNDRQEGLECAVCGLDASADEDNKLVKCGRCDEAVHLGCLKKYEARGDIDCVACTMKVVLGDVESAMINADKRQTGKNAGPLMGLATQPRTQGMMRVKIKLAPTLSDIDKARLVQVVRGEAMGLTENEAKALLSRAIARRGTLSSSSKTY